MMRHRRVLLWLVAGLVLLLAVAWWLLPSVLVAVANGRLPRQLDNGITVLALHRSPAGLELPAIHLRLDPQRARELGAQAVRRWIPPGLVRRGLCVTGTIATSETASIPWRVELDDEAQPPQLAISLTAQQANDLIASRMRTIGSGSLALHVVPRLATAELTELDPGLRGRRFRLDATGTLHVAIGVVGLDVPVRRLLVEAEVELRASVAGWEPELTTRVIELDAPLPAIGGIDNAAVRHALELAANTMVDERTLPAWFPTDLRLSAVVR
jgi:hypothetical protein